jgi:hypothetical protein
VEILHCPENIRERGHPARTVRGIAARNAGRMPALPDISSFPGARQPTGMSDCHENAVGAALAAAQGAHKGRPYKAFGHFHAQ